MHTQPIIMAKRRDPQSFAITKEGSYRKSDGKEKTEFEKCGDKTPGGECDNDLPRCSYRDFRL